MKIQNKLILKTFSFFLLAFLLFSPVLIFAQQNVDKAGKIINPIKTDTVQEFLKNLLEGVIKISIPIIVLALIYSGFLFVSARGAPDKLKKAKDALLYTVIGTAVLLGSWAIAQIVTNTILAL